MKTLYTAHVTTIAGRDGYSKSDDGIIDLKQARPGSSDKGTNPEQLFAAGYSACFGSAVAFVAQRDKLKIDEVKIQADVNLQQDDSGFSISVVLNASLAGLDDATARKVVEAAHQVCPYSKATRGNINVELRVNNEPLKKAA